MEIFKHRHLALGLGVFLISLYISYYMGILVRVLLLVISVMAFVAILTIFLIKKEKSMLDKVIRYAFICVFIALAMILAITCFQREKAINGYCDGEKHKIEGTITEEKYEKPYESRYVVKINKIDDKDYSFESLLTLYGDGLNIGDSFRASVGLTPLEDTFSYYERSAYKDEGIIVSAEISEYEVISQGSGEESIFKRLNNALSEHFYKYLSDDTASMMSSLLLGNDHLLDDSIKRDFSRIGISHVLALSGMHITIITMILGLALKPFKIHIVLKNLILISFTFFFVALTGFSDSAMRAGIMVCIFYLISMIGYGADTITTLLLSVSIICFVSPYSIFSVSLMLSFLAMLGCLVSFKFIRKIKLRIRLKPLRSVVYTLTSTIFVLGFTLPVTFSTFGTLPLLSPLANIIIAPAFNLLIYFSVVLLALLGIPYLGDALAWLAEKSTGISVLAVKWLASFEGIVIPTFTTLQYIGMVLIFGTLIAMMLVKRKHIVHTLVAALVGVCVFSGGTVALLIDRYTNNYVSVSTYKTSDFVFLEGKNELTVIDASATTNGIYNTSAGAISHLNYTEVENYIICDYSYQTNKYFEKLSKNYKIRNLYLQEPQNDDEKIMYNKLYKIADEEDIQVKILEKRLDVSDFELEFSPIDTLSRSKKRCISFSAEANGCELLYLGSGSYEIFDKFTEEKAKTADVVVFGSYGPSYHVSYYYDMPYLDKAMFLGNSYDFARDKMKNQLSDKMIFTTIEPIKFKLEE